MCAYDGIKPQYKSSVVHVYTEFWFGVLKRLPTSVGFLAAVEDRSSIRPLSRWRWKWLLFPWPRSEKELLEDETTLPSWVPNFHKPLEPMSLTLHYGSGTFNATRGLDDDNDDDDQGAAADSKFVARHINLDPQLNAITLKGYYVDTIRVSGESGAEIWENNDVSRLLTLLLEAIQEPAAERRPYGCTRGVFEAYWHCMAVQADVGNDGDWPPAPSRRADCRDWLRHTLALSLIAKRFAGVVFAWPPALRRISALPNWRLSPNYAAFSRLRVKVSAEARLGTLPPEEVADCLVPSPGEVDRHLYHYTNRMRRRLRVLHGDAVDDETPLLDGEEDTDGAGADLGYGEAVDASVFGDVSLKTRRLFATRGGYLGKGTQALREGDEIWLLKGAEVPFILRKVAGTNRHRLVGHAYVHGIMYGEMAEKLKQGGLRTVVLE